MYVKLLLIMAIQQSLVCAVKKCCDEKNNYISKRMCADGIAPNLKDCPTVYTLQANDSETNIDFDETDRLMIDMEDPVPTDEYCFTIDETSNEGVYLVCYTDETDAVEEASTSINIVLQFISVFFIALTVIIYVTLPQMLDLQGISIIHSMIGLAVAYIALGVVNLSTLESSTQCHFIAYLMYVSFLYAFFWLNVLCSHIWRQVVNPTILKNIKNWKAIYYTYAIGGPLLCLFLLAVIHHSDLSYLKGIHPGIAEGKCWFKSLQMTMIYFYGPISVLLTINIVYFISTAITLWKQSKTCSKTKILRYRLRLYIKLFFIMGITWIFEIISAAMSNYKGAIKWIWLITDALNGLEGLIIFLILVVFRKKVVRLLASRKYFYKYRLPNSWRQAYDSECHQLEEEMNLSV